MKRKVIRAITGLLCAAMFFSNVAGMSVYAMEDGAGQEMLMQEYSWDEEDEKAEGAEQAGSDEELETRYPSARE